MLRQIVEILPLNLSKILVERLIFKFLLFEEIVQLVALYLVVPRVSNFVQILHANFVEEREVVVAATDCQTVYAEALGHFEQLLVPNLLANLVVFPQS